MIKPLKERLDSLPLILCGPILRRTQPDSVTVWLALRKPRSVRLDIFTRNATGWTPTGLTGSAQTVALGDNLHIVAVTATGTGGKKLAWGELYAYDLNFESRSGVDTAGVGRLFAGAANNRTGVFAPTEEAARAALTYRHIDKALDLPSFVLPPDATKTKGSNPLNHLRVCHGSCRRAHGESFDALATMDVILAKSMEPGARDPRPHMLLLTGDQIYADDVADALLSMLIDASDALIGPAENLPGKDKTPGPGRRAQFGRALGLTAMIPIESAAKSHLFHFGEYAAMYLFAWSDLLWPARDEEYPGPEIYPEKEKNESEQDRFGKELKQLKLFRRTLPDVRRAVANVPVYMIFDDHEISDDWNLNLRWISGVLQDGNKAGRRVVTNGLLAYALFQAWGNTPAQFADEDDSPAAGRRLLNAASVWRGKEDASEAEIINCLSIPTYQGHKRVPGDETAPLLHWHYTIETPNFLCLLLDTRTMRGFPRDRLDPPDLLNDKGFALQIGQAPATPPDGIILVVATTNVFSEPSTEIAVEAIHSTKLGEAAVFFPDRGDAWVPQSRAYERLLAMLADRAPDTGEPRRKARVVIATGDIHYGFAARAQYWGDRPYRAPSDKAKSAKPVDAVFAQFTASAFRNEATKTRTLHSRAFLTVENDDQKLDILMSGAWIGWREPPGPLEAFVAPKIPTNLRSAPATLKVKGLSPLSYVRKVPDWRYRIDFIKDPTAYLLGGIHVMDAPKLTSEQRNTQVKALAAAHKEYAEKGAGRIVVGRNNVGETRFRWGAGDSKAAIQTLWWRLTENAEPAPLTNHEIPLGFDEDRFPKPSYPGE